MRIAPKSLPPLVSLLPGLALLFAGGPAASAQQYTISTVAGGTLPLTPVTAAGAAIGTPRRVAAGPSGSVYFTAGNAVFKLAGGTVSPVAGNSRAGFSGDGGPAANAQLMSPAGLALDSAGNLYIADAGNHRVRKVTTAGTITTVAGNGSPGYSGDGGGPTDAQLFYPSGVAVDSNGNLYIADTGNHAIREVAPGGAISTLAGNGAGGFTGDTYAPSVALLYYPEDVAVDSSNNVYIADTGNLAVRKIASNVINTLGGRGTNTADGEQATTAILSGPYAVAVDGSGNVFVTEYSGAKVRKLLADGTIATVAGTGTNGFAGDNAAAPQAQLSTPTGVAVDGSGNVYIADSGNQRIRQVSSSGSISTVAGNGSSNFSGDGGKAATAQLNWPRGVAADANGNLFIADTANHRIRKVSSSGSISTVAGNGTAGFAGDGSAGTGAQLNAPFGLAVDPSGNLYIADTGNSRVRRLTTDGVINTVAGNGTPGFAGDNGTANSAQLNSPVGVAVDGAGNLYIADTSNNRVRKVTPGGLITTVAGNGITAFAGDGGPANQASLFNPFAVAADPAGNLYIADTSNHVVRIVSPGGTISTFAGDGGIGYSGEGGPASQAELAAPNGLAVDKAGNVYISEPASRILKVATDGTIATIAGTGKPGYSGDGGPATSARFSGAAGIAIDPNGILYFADSLNNAVRMLQPVTGP